MKDYEKRECVSIKWSHPEDSSRYFSVGVSKYDRGFGWSARASDGENYFWKRGTTTIPTSGQPTSPLLQSSTL